MWTKSACVVLAWGILLILVAVGIRGSARPAQANIRIASSTTNVTLTSTLNVAAAPVKATNPGVRYVVQPGDTLSGIAAALAVRGGWRTLYAANRRVVGADPNVIHPGIVLVLPGQTAATRYTVAAGDTLSGIATALAVRGGWRALYAANRRVVGADPNVIHPGIVLVLPGQTAAIRYTVAAGDTLSGIATALAVRGGWRALYAANRRVIGPDPNTIHPGTVLTVARPAAPATTSSGPHRRVHPAPPPAPARTGHRAAPVIPGAPAPAGMPRWLATMLLAVGLLIGAAFLVDLVLVAARRHRQRLRSRPLATQGGVFTRWRPRVGSGPPAARREPFTGWGSRTGPRPPAPRREPFTGWEPRIVLADYDRLVVTHCKTDDTVYVLRPPGEDPRAILRVARLVLKEDPYQELAAKLGVPANWPME